MWRNYVEEAEAEPTNTEEESSALKTEYVDVIISDVRTTPNFGFSVQKLGNESKF